MARGSRVYWLRLCWKWWLRSSAETLVMSESGDGRVAEPWQIEACWRCDVHHPRHCDLCSNDPPCADHVCVWETDDDENDEMDEDQSETVEIHWSAAAALAVIADSPQPEAGHLGAVCDRVAEDRRNDAH